MKKIKLGKTNLMVSASSFGALPIQRDDKQTAAAILRAAYEGGINFFDTANAYTDSEEKIGYALHDVRQNIVISTKSGATTKDQLLKHIQLSLKRLQTDYIDILQLHNPSTLPDPNDPNGLYAGLLEAKRAGYIRHIGITNHSLQLATQAAKSGLYETVQFPFSSLATEEEIELTRLCKQLNIGFIAMKGLAGGLITNAATTFSFIKQFDNVVPIWGIQRMEELQEFLRLEENPPAYDEEMKAKIQADREVLVGGFCRGCGYCKPCPAGIDIPNMARLSLLLRRSPWQPWYTPENQKEVLKIKNCLHCNACASRCPYHLNTPELLQSNLQDYLQFAKEHGITIE